MEQVTMQALAMVGAFSAIGFSAVGSALGCGAAGASTIGAMKKVYSQGKNPSLLLMGIAGAALTQTIYGLVLTFLMLNKIATAGGKIPEAVDYWPLFLLMGSLAGIAMGFSAWFQGKAAAGASPAYTETDGKGFANYLIILGLIETVALFVFVVVLLLLGKI